MTVYYRTPDLVLLLNEGLWDIDLYHIVMKILKECDVPRRRAKNTLYWYLLNL